MAGDRGPAGSTIARGVDLIAVTRAGSACVLRALDPKMYPRCGNRSRPIRLIRSRAPPIRQGRSPLPIGSSIDVSFEGCTVGRLKGDGTGSLAGARFRSLPPQWRSSRLAGRGAKKQPGQSGWSEGGPCLGRAPPAQPRSLAPSDATGPPALARHSFPRAQRSRCGPMPRQSGVGLGRDRFRAG